MRRIVVGVLCIALSFPLLAATTYYAEDVTQESFGMLRCSFGGGITVGGLINYDNWGKSAQPTFSVSNMTGYVLSTHGNMFAKGRWTLGSNGARRGEVPVSFAEGRLRLAARTARDPKNATLLYELARGGDLTQRHRATEGDL